ncbi:hypothetical protein BDN72DRAFT_863798 [Pluteus cervinus]|uniref:Uncharacterized protein n=1 Tax=Pluteus cervinus TaxID=181527 RepID=A0ACD3A633_9AGAR|nr:hypothetical protein BDN72DRAFT_863798 [Pluteus cervinus]
MCKILLRHTVVANDVESELQKKPSNDEYSDCSTIGEMGLSIKQGHARGPEEIHQATAETATNRIQTRGESKGRHRDRTYRIRVAFIFNAQCAGERFSRVETTRTKADGKSWRQRTQVGVEEVGLSRVQYAGEALVMVVGTREEQDGLEKRGADCWFKEEQGHSRYEDGKGGLERWFISRSYDGDEELKWETRNSGCFGQGRGHKSLVSRCRGPENAAGTQREGENGEEESNTVDNTLGDMLAFDAFKGSKAYSSPPVVWFNMLVQALSVNISCISIPALYTRLIEDEDETVEVESELQNEGSIDERGNGSTREGVSAHEVHKKSTRQSRKQGCMPDISTLPTLVLGGGQISTRNENKVHTMLGGSPLRIPTNGRQGPSWRASPTWSRQRPTQIYTSTLVSGKGSVK